MAHAAGVGGQRDSVRCVVFASGSFFFHSTFACVIVVRCAPCFACVVFFCFFASLKGMWILWILLPDDLFAPHICVSIFFHLPFLVWSLCFSCFFLLRLLFVCFFFHFCPPSRGECARAPRRIVMLFVARVDGCNQIIALAAFMIVGLHARAIGCSCSCICAQTHIRQDCTHMHACSRSVVRL
jgi:hypothetical protein